NCVLLRECARNRCFLAADRHIPRAPPRGRHWVKRTGLVLGATPRSETLATIAVWYRQVPWPMLSDPSAILANDLPIVRKCVGCRAVCQSVCHFLETELELDDIDRGIATLLRRDGRLSSLEIARKLNVSDRTVRHRLARLTKRHGMRVAVLFGES